MKSLYRFTLSNGLRVVYIPYEAVNTVTICLRGLAGSNYETNDEIGIAHLLEHFVTFGSKKHPNTDTFRNIVLKRGGRITGTTSRDEVAFLVKVLKPDLKYGLTYLSELFFYPELNKEKLKKVKKTVIQEIMQNIENPQSFINRAALTSSFPKTRLSEFNTGNVNQVNVIEYENILDFWTRQYNADNFVLTVCGDIKYIALRKYIKQYFSLKTNKQKLNKPVIRHCNKFVVNVISKENVEQCHIRCDFIGFKTSDKRKYASQLVAKMLLSKLTNAIYENNRVNAYTLNVESFSSNTYGLVSIYAAINNKGKKSYIKILKKLEAQIISETIEDKVLKYYKKKIIADFEFNYEKTSLRADLYSELVLFDQVERSHKKELKRYLDVTSKEIKKAIKSIFKSGPKITILTKEKNTSSIKNSIASIYINN